MIGQQINKHVYNKQKPNECIICTELNMYILYPVGGEYADAGTGRGRGGTGDKGIYNTQTKKL